MRVMDLKECGQDAVGGRNGCLGDEVRSGATATTGTKTQAEMSWMLGVGLEGGQSRG